MISLLTLLLQPAHAVPAQMNHQGRLVDSSGAALNGSHFLTFKLYDSETGGTALWQESQATDFTDGYYSVEIGANGTLDSELLDQHPLWMELQLDTNDPMEPRYAMASVPYAQMSETAASVSGPVDATEVMVNGVEVIDSDGNWVGPEISVSGGGSSSGGTSGPVYWSDIQNIPSDISDGDDDTFLSEGDVESYIENGTVNLATGSRMGGFDLMTTNSTLSPYWSDLQGIPSDISDGDDDTYLSESDVEGYVTNGVINLAANSKVDGFPILTTDTVLEPDWGDVQNIPSDIADGDDDTLAGLGCADGEVVGWDGSEWVCTSIAVTAQLSEGEVEGYIENGPVALASGSTVGGDDILTADDLEDPEWDDLQDIPADIEDGDDDSLAALACQTGETVEWTGSAWGCASVSFSDSDTLGGLACADGQVAVRSGGAWACGDLSDSDSLASLGCGSGEIAMYSADAGAWACAALSDSDSLGVLSCTGGQVAAYSADDGGWVCTDISDSDSLSALECADGEAALWSEDDGAWICGEAGGVSGELAKSNHIGESDGGIDFASLDTPEAFPDDNVAGFTSARYISDSIDIRTMSVDLEITHPDMGEVTAVLTSPTGTAVQLVAASYAGTEDFDGNIGWDYAFAEGDLYSFYGEDTVGTWTLNIVDLGSGNTGNLESWTMRFSEDWDGDIFVGDNVTVQETIAVRGEMRVEYGGKLVFTDTEGEETVSIDGQTGSIQGLPTAAYRWADWSTYHGDWVMGNNADLFGGVNPSSWSGGAYAHDMSSDKGVLSDLFRHKGYLSSTGNSNVVSKNYSTYHTSDSSRHAAVLFRVRNTTEQDIDWSLYYYFSAYGSWSDYASLALNGQNQWTYTSNCNDCNNNVTMSIPADRTSTVILVSSGYYWTSQSNTTKWNLQLAFYNNSLLLPEGLEFVDDLDDAENGWDY